LTLVFLFPIFWAVSSSLRVPTDRYTVEGLGLPWLDFQPTLANWRAELAYAETLRALGRSTLVTLSTTALALLLALPAAHSLARRERHGGAASSDATAAIVIALRLVPPVLLLVPFYLLFRALGLLDTQLALVLVNTTVNLPLAVLLTRQAFADVPRALEDAALVDGASPLRVFLGVSLPLAMPGIVAAGLIVSAFAWNDYLFAIAMFVLETRTMPISITSVAGTGAGLMVRTLLAMSVPVALALIAQRGIIQGLTLGAVRG
jgi:multiple sugar transport system permease protein